MLSEIFPGSSPKVGATYWDQVQELAMISVIKRILQRLHDILDLVSFYLLVTNHWIFDLLLDFSPCLVLSIVPLKKKAVTFQHPCLYSYIKGFSLLYILKHNPTNYIKKQHKLVMFVASIPVIQHLIQLKNYILSFKYQNLHTLLISSRKLFHIFKCFLPR